MERESDEGGMAGGVTKTADWTQNVALLLGDDGESVIAASVRRVCCEM